jgi:hypothetical protein
MDASPPLKEITYDPLYLIFPYLPRLPVVADRTFLRMFLFLSTQITSCAATGSEIGSCATVTRKYSRSFLQKKSAKIPISTMEALLKRHLVRDKPPEQSRRPSTIEIDLDSIPLQSKLISTRWRNLVREFVSENNLYGSSLWLLTLQINC